MHTKEPWVVGESRQFGFFHVSVDETCEFVPRSLALTGVIGDIDHEESVANARRIVACVNACAGIPTAHLETCGLALFNHYVTVEDVKLAHQQRDELLAALKAIKATLERESEAVSSPIQDTIWHGPAETLFDFIDVAIAKCEA